MAASRTLRLVGAMIAPFAFLQGGALVAACSSDSNSNPQPVYNVTDASDSTVGADAGNPNQDSSSPTPEGSSEGSSDDASGDATGDATADTGGDAVEETPPVDAAACTTDAGCWSCTPSTPTQFLNQCTGSSCSPFDNLQRLPNYDGGLPPLQ